MFAVVANRWAMGRTTACSSATVWGRPLWQDAVRGRPGRVTAYRDPGSVADRQGPCLPRLPRQPAHRPCRVSASSIPTACANCSSAKSRVAHARLRGACFAGKPAPQVLQCHQNTAVPVGASSAVSSGTPLHLWERVHPRWARSGDTGLSPSLLSAGPAPLHPPHQQALRRSAPCSGAKSRAASANTPLPTPMPQLHTGPRPTGCGR